MRQRTVVLAVLMAVLATGAAPLAPAQEAKRCPAALPPEVAAKRQAIIVAAQTNDWAGLKKQIGPGEFVYSFGDDSDAIAYWQDAQKQGMDVTRFMAAVLAMPCVVTVDTGAYLWPSAAAIDWQDLTPAEKKSMEALYGKAIDEWYVEGRAKGYYIGWRLSIEKNGAWSAFVAGD